MSGSLHCDRQPALVLGTGAGLATGFDLAAFCQKSTQGRYVLVVDGLGFFQAEGAYLAPWREAPAAIPPRAGILLISSGPTLSPGSPFSPGAFLPLGSCLFTHCESNTPFGS